MTDHSDGQRVPRFTAAVLYFLLSGTILAAFSIGPSAVQRSQAFLIYAGYLVAQGVLLVLLSRRLYRQHEMQRIRFDIGALMMVTAMFALPMGAMSALRSIGPRQDPDEWSFAEAIVFCNLFISLLPLVACCEALTSWWSRIRRGRTEGRKIQNE